MNAQTPLGPAVDAAPRPLPARTRLDGTHAVLEPLHPRHADDLWREARGDDASWAYLADGPFADAAGMRRFVCALAAAHDPLAWAVRRVDSGRVAGIAALLDIRPWDAAIEIGHLWFGPGLRRSRAATEALYMPMRLAMETLGYRRLTWKCHDLNAASHQAARRLGFVSEGVLRAHKVVKGRRRDTAYYSLLAEEWPARAAAIRAWLADANFEDGHPRESLPAIRARLFPDG